MDGGVPPLGITRQEVKEVMCYLLGVTAVSRVVFWMSLVLQALVSQNIQEESHKMGKSPFLVLP